MIKFSDEHLKGQGEVGIVHESRQNGGDYRGGYPFPGNIAQAEEPFTGTIFGYMVVIAADSLCHDCRTNDGNPVSLYRAAGRYKAVLDRHCRLQFTTMGIEGLQENILGTHMRAKTSGLVYQDVMGILSLFQITGNALANFLYVRVVPERYRFAHDCIHGLSEQQVPAERFTEKLDEILRKNASANGAVPVNHRNSVLVRLPEFSKKIAYTGARIYILVRVGNFPDPFPGNWRRFCFKENHASSSEFITSS